MHAHLNLTLPISTKSDTAYFSAYLYYLFLFFLHFLKIEVTIYTLPHLNVLGCFPCVQVISHLKCTRLGSVRSSLSCINIGVRILLFYFLYVLATL